ncbi:hypothetical protein KKB84_04660 [bacterium]|nr:hypothetical protein [bacterium]
MISLSKKRYLSFFIIFSLLLMVSCGKKKIIKKYHVTKDEEAVFCEVQPKAWKKIYISSKFNETPKSNFILSKLKIEKDNLFKLDPTLQSIFLVLKGEGLFYDDQKEFLLREEIAGYGYDCSAFIKAGGELELILLEKEPSLEMEKGIIIKNLFWISKENLPGYNEVSAKIIFHPQKDKTNFFIILAEVLKDRGNINYDIHPQQHGVFCLQGEIKGKFYNEEKEFTINPNDTAFTEGHFPHILTGVAEESLLFIYQG